MQTLKHPFKFGFNERQYLIRKKFQRKFWNNLNFVKLQILDLFHLTALLITIVMITKRNLRFYAVIENNWELFDSI